MTKRLVAIGLVLVIAACGGGAARPAESPRLPPLDRVERLLPPGAGWIVIARPAELWRAAAVRRALTPVIEERDLTQYATRTGIHLTTLSELAAAGYGERGTLVVLRGPDTSKSIRQTLALSATRPFELRTVRRDVAVVATGREAGILLDEGRRRGGRVVADLPPEITVLRRWVGRAPLQLLIPIPLEVERDTPAGVLLSGVRSVAASATPRGAEIAFRVDLTGDFPATAGDNFRRMLISMAEDGLGEIFGLGDVARSARIEASATRVTIESGIAAASVAEGIETLFVAKLQELLGTRNN